MSSKPPSRLPTPPLALSALLLCAFGYAWTTPPKPKDAAPNEHPRALDLSLAARHPDARPTPRPRPLARPTSRS